jgi:hypothetical protein
MFFLTQALDDRLVKASAFGCKVHEQGLRRFDRLYCLVQWFGFEDHARAASELIIINYAIRGKITGIYDAGIYDTLLVSDPEHAA